jgi:membrane protease YdiL (CAAX protease family)
MVSINHTVKKEDNYNVSPIKFVTFTFLIAWLSWGIILVGNRYGHLAYGTPAMLFFYGFGALSPFDEIIALLPVIRNRQSSVKALFKRIFDFNEPPVLYIVVIGVAALMKIVPLWLGMAAQTAPFYMAIVLIPYDLVGGGLEEIGWRFIFQTSLEKKMPFAAMCLLTGMIWALWHLPLFWMEGTHQSEFSFFAFTIWVIGMSFFLAAIFRVSRSVLLCIVFHTVSNAVGETISVDMGIGAAAGYAAVLIVLSFMLIKICENRSHPHSFFSRRSR